VIVISEFSRLSEGPLLEAEKYPPDNLKGNQATKSVGLV
jgi:hypothetical protein